MITSTAIGRLGRDAETRSTNSGTEITSFAIAIDQGFGDKKTTLWADCSLWGDRGRKLAPHLTKGSQIAVTGEPGMRTWNKPDGSQGVAFTIRVSDVKLLGGNRDGNQRQQQQQQQQQRHVDDDEIPF